MKSFFINEAVDKAVNDYMSSNQKPEGTLYNSFLVVVIRMLVLIYGELDIINPYQMHNEEAFDNNLMKYGASKQLIDNLKRLLDGYYIIEKKNNSSIIKEMNNYFIEVQKVLIDLFNFKRINFGLTDSESQEFFDLLYTPKTSNALRMSYNYLNAEDVLEVANYYDEKLKEENIKVSNEDLLDIETSKIVPLEAKINNSVEASYEYVNDENNEIDEANIANMLTRPLTTGNGYVDILLIMSIIVTAAMVVVIFGTIVF